MRSVFGLVLSVLIWTIPAYSQDDSRRPDDRLELRGVAGWARFADIDHRVVGIVADVRVVGGLRVGPEVIYNIGPRKDRDITVLPLVSYDFRRLKQVVPFVSGGYGWLRHTDGFRTANSFSFGAGAGLKLNISDRLFVAPEARLGWEPVLRMMVSVGYRF